MEGKQKARITARVVGKMSVFETQRIIQRRDSRA